MTDALRHRGPDGEGFYEAPGIHFGHRRLAIIDREGGAQPFHARTRKCILSYNGEIYNHAGLAARLNMRGHTMHTRSDTEVVAEGLAYDGAKFIHEMRGMFAFAFWDDEQGALLLARDRLGEKPLYYAVTHDGFLIFASEICALAVSGLIALELNPEAVMDYFYYGYVPDPKTIYRGVSKLEAGHQLSVKRGGDLKIEQYWKPAFAPSPARSFEQASDELCEKLDEAVRLQMVTDVPLGAFLSGGVDSSGIVAAMAQTGVQPVTCTAGFNDAAFDERVYARVVADRFSTNHHELTAQLNAVTLIDDVARAFGEPFADISALPTYLVAKLAREHVTVALSGDGGDEVFGGYRRYRFFTAEERLRSLLPSSLRHLVFGSAGAVYPKLDWAPQPFRLKTTLQALGDSRAKGYARAVAINFPDRVRTILSGDFKYSLAGYCPQTVIESAMDGAGCEDPLLLAQYTDYSTWLSGRMLVKADRTSMAHSLEVRAPLLDSKLVDWAGLLPPSYKNFQGSGKRILKAALAPRFEEGFLDRKKQGFTPPLAEWLRSNTNNPISRLEDSSLWSQSGILDEKAVRSLAVSHSVKRVDASQELWTVIMFDAFLRNQAKPPSPV